MISSKSKRISEFIVDETLFKVEQNMSGFGLQQSSQETSKFSHQQYQRRGKCLLLLKDFFQNQWWFWSHLVSIGEGTWYPPQACSFLKLQQQHHPSFEKNMVEMTMHYIKDRTTESFDGYFPCRLENCKLTHVKNWLNLFIDYHNKEGSAKLRILNYIFCKINCFCRLLFR